MRPLLLPEATAVHAGGPVSRTLYDMLTQAVQ